MLLAAVDVTGRNLPPWPEDFGVELVTAQPGQALLFSESMQHSTYPCARTTTRTSHYESFATSGTGCNEQRGWIGLGEHAAQHLPVRPHRTLLHARSCARGRILPNGGFLAESFYWPII